MRVPCFLPRNPAPELSHGRSDRPRPRRLLHSKRRPVDLRPSLADRYEPAQSGTPAAPQTFQQGNGNLATKQLPPTAPPNYSPFERDLMGAFSGLGGYLAAAANPVANMAQRVGAYLGGTPEQAAAVDQHINAQQYLGSGEAQSFLKDNPHFVPMAQQDPVGFATDLQKHLGLARSSLDSASAQAPAPAPAPVTIQTASAPPGATYSQPLALPASLAPRAGAAPASAHAQAQSGTPSFDNFYAALRASGATNAGMREYIGAVPSYSPGELAGAMIAARQTREISDKQAKVEAQHDNNQINQADYDRARQQNMQDYLNAMNPIYYRNPLFAAGMPKIGG